MPLETQKPDVNVAGGSVSVNQGAPNTDPNAWPVKLTDGVDVASVRDLTNSNPIDVAVVDSNGDQVTQFGLSQQDKTTFTEGTDRFVPVGGVFNDTLAGDVAEDQSAAARITRRRAVHANLRNNDGTEIGTTANPAQTGSPDGANAALGTTTDAEATGNGSVIAILKRLRTIFSDIWDDANNRFRVGIHDDGNSISVDDGGGSITVDGTVTAIASTSDTATRSSVAGSATVVTVLASNTSRKGATIWNDSTAQLFVGLGSSASLVDFTVRLNPQEYYEVPFSYTGIITGIWATATGNARVTELT